MAAEHLTATLRSNLELVSRQVRASAQGINVVESTVEVTADAEANSTYHMARIPSNARIVGLSELAADDLASSGSPELDIGLFAVGANITSDPDALNDAIDCATGATVSRVIKSLNNYGKQAWEFVNGQTTDPGGFLDIKVSLVEAAANDGGTLTLSLFYTID